MNIYIATATFNTRPKLTREKKEFTAPEIGIAYQMSQTCQVWGNIHPGCCIIGAATVELKTAGSSAKNNQKK